MEISEKIGKFKFHLFFIAAFSLVIFSTVYIAPKFLDIVKYFWPLLLSTALFLATVAAFSRISPPVAEAAGENAGEGILDFVAGQHELSGLPPIMYRAGRIGETEE